MTVNKQLLIDQASRAAEKSHVPYSGRQQGAALQADDGLIYPGATLEVFGLAGSICPDAGSLAAAASTGRRQFACIAVMPARWPCGSCLQLLKEFGDMDVITQTPDGTIHSRRVSELLP